MTDQNSISDLCNALGITASTSYSWDDRSVEFTITAPIYPGINSCMGAEEYLYAALQGIYAYQYGHAQKHTKAQTDQTVSAKKPSYLARLLKRYK